MSAPAGSATSCFVVMPFGKKPLRDGSGRLYDFDKVFRVVMADAIRKAGMTPRRADYEKSAKIIHTDMFRDLRDSEVVLADLSLENPNVFYELGIRHVMSNRGTVLMCNECTELPFDVKLSRVIFYRYDGESLDFEHAEELRGRLFEALGHARKGEPDSPVHALLEQVSSRHERKEPRRASSASVVSARRDPLEDYQRIVAAGWAEKQVAIDELTKKFGDSSFGIRSLAYRCLDESAPIGPKVVLAVARLAFQHEAYDLAVELYERASKDETLETRDRLTYASCLSERDDDLPGAEAAIAIVHEVLAEIKGRRERNPGDLASMAEAAHAQLTLGGLLQWKWNQLGRVPADLAAAIDAFTAGLTDADAARSRGLFPQPGRIANARIRLLLSQRKLEQNLEREDHEGHREAILRLGERRGDEATSLSYVRWYQAIVLADRGDADDSESRADAAFKSDGKLLGKSGHGTIGRRQYTLLRRFMEGDSEWLRNPSLLGRISRLLQTDRAGAD